jgi:hypothetical protein
LLLSILVQVQVVVHKYAATDIRCQDSADYYLLMRYLMSVVIFSHFQRPSVVRSMLCREVLTAKTATDGRTVIMVSEHKISASGPAQVALEKEDYKLFQLFLRK